MRTSLNTFVLEGRPLGAITAGDADRQGGFLRTLVMRPGGPALDLDQTFKRLTDQAQAACRLADFDAELEVLQATEREIFDLTSRLSGARQTFVTSLAGWQPEIQFRISLHRLGRAVLGSESVDIVNRWLYFVQEMLVATRSQRREDLQQIFHLWTQVATRQDIPDGWNYLARLSEFAKTLDLDEEDCSCRSGAAPAAILARLRRLAHPRNRSRLATGRGVGFLTYCFCRSP